MAGIRPPDAVIEERAALALTCLQACWPKYRILDTLQAEYGVTRHAAEDDMARARAKMREEDDSPRQYKRSKLSAFFEDIMSNPQARTRERIRAAREYMRLHALAEQPVSGDSPDVDIEVVIPDWRAHYEQQLEGGGVRSVDDGLHSGNGANSSNGKGSH